MNIRNFGIIPFLVMIGLVLARYSVHTEPIQTTQPSVSFSQIALENPQTTKSALSTTAVNPENNEPKNVNVQDTNQTASVVETQRTNTSLLEKASTSLSHEGSPTSSIPTRLIIPSLKVDIEIVSIPFDETTWNLDGLGDKIAWLDVTPSSRPLNNTILAGHVTLYNGSNGPFRYLARLKPGSKIIVFNGHQPLTYQVRDLSLVYPEAIEVLGDTKNKELTLLTCTTWDETTKSYLRRLVVRADLVEIETKIVQD